MRSPASPMVVLCAALALAACDGAKRQRAEDIAADAAVSPKAAPLRFALSTADARVELDLPPGIRAYPQLHRRLFDDGRQELLDFAKEARDDRQRLARKGVSQPSPYVRRVTWTLAAVTPRLVSVEGRWFDDTGGVHPDHGSLARLWDRRRREMLPSSDLFRDDADQGPLDQALCKAVTKLKAARMGPTDPDSWSCPRWADSQAVLVPSVRPYRIGGLRFLFDPYVIGAYAEGDYAVLIPLSDFQAALAPAWAQDFEGSPAPGVASR